MNAAEANPWLIFGDDLKTVSDDFLGQNDGTFADLFSNEANEGGVGDLGLMFDHFGDALDYSFGIDAPDVDLGV